jgi:hypothetical protein
MNWKRFDWKFVATIVAAIAGLAVPIVLWQSDLAAHSLTVRLLSTTALQPAANIQNLQISLNGQNIDSPYLSSFELINSGSKAVLTADFESPIEIAVNGAVRLVSVQTTTTVPKNIPAKLSITPTGAEIAPFLSNPKDIVVFSIITSGGKPSFEARSRIAGISEIGFEDSSAKRIEYWKPLSLAIWGTMFFLLYAIYLPSAILRKRFVIPRWLGVVSGLGFGIASLLFLNTANDQIDSLPNKLYLMSGFSIFLLLVTAIAMKPIMNIVRASADIPEPYEHRGAQGPDSPEHDNC